MIALQKNSSSPKLGAMVHSDGQTALLMNQPFFRTAELSDIEQIQTLMESIFGFRMAPIALSAKHLVAAAYPFCMLFK